MTEPFVPTGHPVRWFVLAIAAIAASLLGLWAVGLGAPRVTVEGLGGEQDAITGRATQRVSVTNEGRFTVTVTGTRGNHHVVLDPLEPVDVPPGGTVEVAVGYTTRCDEGRGYVFDVDLVVRGPLGVADELSIDRGGAMFSPPATCPTPPLPQ